MYQLSVSKHNGSDGNNHDTMIDPATDWLAMKQIPIPEIDIENNRVTVATFNVTK